MRSIGLIAGLLAGLVCITPVPSAAGEQVIMRRTCSVENGQVVLKPTADVRRLDVVSDVEQRVGRVCKHGDAGLCTSEAVFRFTVDCGGTRISWLSVFATEHAQDPEKQFSDGHLLVALGGGKWQAMPPGFAPLSPKFMEVTPESVAEGLPQSPDLQSSSATQRTTKHVMYGMHYLCDASSGDVSLQPSGELIWHEVIGDTASVRYRTCAVDENEQQVCTLEFSIWRFGLNCAGDRAVPLSVVYANVRRLEKDERSELQGTTLLVVARTKIASTYPFDVIKYFLLIHLTQLRSGAGMA